VSDKPWKRFERKVGALIGGRRFWANAGEALDCEGPLFVAQCKHVKAMSLTELSELAEQVEREAAPKLKAGVVAVQQRRGAGRTAPLLIVMTEGTFRQLHGAAADQTEAVR
jgi:hypothetical protein